MCGRQMKDGISTPKKSTPAPENDPPPDPGTPGARLAQLRAGMSASKPGPRLSILSQANVMIAKQKGRRATEDEDENLAGLIPDGADGEQGVTITASKLEAIKKALTEKVKAQCADIAAQDIAILEMELQDLRSRADRVEAENKQHKATLDEVLTTLEGEIKDHETDKSKARANIGLLEIDLKQARDIAEEKSAQHKQIYTEYTHMKDNWDKMVGVEAALKKQLAATEAQLAEAQKNFETLKSHADSKLKAAGSQYMSVTNLAREKEEKMNKLQEERDVLQTRLNSQEKVLNNLKIANEQLSNTLTKAQEVEKKNHELSAALAAKTQDFNGLMAAAQESKKSETTLQGRIKQTELVNKDLTEDNNRYKKLYEATHSAGSAGGGSNSAQVARLEKDVCILEEALGKKDKENAELLAICEELMKDVERYKTKR